MTAYYQLSGFADTLLETMPASAEDENESTADRPTHPHGLFGASTGAPASREMIFAKTS
jgi:hypothetical protein